MAKETGGPAFPRAGKEWEPSESGMTLRDWFAGMALQGLMANPNTEARSYKQCAQDAYVAADAMLEARKS